MSSNKNNLKDTPLAAVHREYLARRKFPTRSRLVEYPLFVQSEFFAAVQLADVCAYELFHAFQAGWMTRDAMVVEEHRGLETVVKMLARSEGLEVLP